MNVMEKFQLRNAVAIVTGGARGLGKAMATAFVQAGAHIVIADKDIAEAQAAARELQQEGQQAVAIQVDVTQEEQIEQLVARVMETFGKIDILVNNAGIALHVKLAAVARRNSHAAARHAR